MDEPQDIGVQSDDEDDEITLSAADGKLVERLLELDRQLSYGKSVMSEIGPATKPTLIYKALIYLT